MNVTGNIINPMPRTMGLPGSIIDYAPKTMKVTGSIASHVPKTMSLPGTNMNIPGTESYYQPIRRCVVMGSHLLGMLCSNIGSIHTCAPSHLS